MLGDVGFFVILTTPSQTNRLETVAEQLYHVSDLSHCNRANSNPVKDTLLRVADHDKPRPMQVASRGRLSLASANRTQSGRKARRRDAAREGTIRRECVVEDFPKPTQPCCPGAMSARWIRRRQVNAI